MKKNILGFLFILAFFPLAAQTASWSDRVYVATDKDVYMAGEALCCAVYCFNDLSDSLQLAGASRIAYLELHNANGQAQTAKVALNGGRGNGVFMLSNNLPTGNYHLVAYTVVNKGQKDFKPFVKTIAVYNVLSAEKAGAVTDSLVAAPIAADAYNNDDVSIKSIASEPGYKELELENHSGSVFLGSISVFADDSIVCTIPYHASDFLKDMKQNPQSPGTRWPDAEGEIIEGRVKQFDTLRRDDYSRALAYLSVVGDDKSVYSSKINPNGDIKFFTSTIFGSPDVVLQVQTDVDDLPSELELKDPFLNPSLDEPAALYLNANMKDRLVKRNASVQMARRFGLDSLFAVSEYERSPLCDMKDVVYKLDQYTRFPTMEEIVSEFITPLHLRRIDKQHIFQTQLENMFNVFTFANTFSMVLLDGVIILNHDKMANYDPLLVESVHVYPNTMILGNYSYPGMVSFHTYKKNMPGMEFDPSVRIVRYYGASMPLYTPEGLRIPEYYPDYRQTIYWQPSCDIKNGESRKIKLRLPAYESHFRVVVEGFTEDGRAVYYSLLLK